ncbi:Protein of unknown function (DUF2530) [Saccharomonospora marina XMU15]|uniref:DUF2530 domain-containing protein n=1 Tax=Saccharomonospora marina XMU15 TaxID=882083 RepID=H5WYZ3_9PSEU|nr:DUF2530 domain-containing protein [Saccharomonospora marina]EHR52927.1 Protein of unknown function (DUF2530) [Saccharomonospora marina XMU15]
MDVPSDPSRTKGRFRPTPQLPRSLVNLWPPMILGTVLWFLAFAVLLITGVRGVWLWTTLAGGGLGIVGMGIMLWQRAAARRGSRPTPHGL